MKWLNRELQKQQLAKGIHNPSFNYAHLTTIQEASVLYAALQEEKQIIVIKENETQARALNTQMESLFPDITTQLFLQEDSLRVEAIASSPENHYEKMEALYNILYHPPKLLLTTSATLMRYLASPELLKERTTRLKIDTEIEMNDLASKLLQMGYQQVQVVEKPFTFARRGGLIDVFTIQHPNPIRIDFFDNLIENMRFFDVETQRSLSDIQEVTLFVASEYLTNDHQKATIINRVNERLALIKEKTEPSTYEILYENIYKDVDDFILNAIDARYYDLFALSNPTHQITDFLPNAKIILSPSPTIEKSAKFFLDESVDYLISKHQELKGLDQYDLFPRTETIQQHKPLLFHQFQAS
ncbi:MAG: hypothetical protein GX775_06155, partial [Erysipelothrix sp.]|nr:hypothetical protein [Erysipelothrix sp.]